MLSSHRGGLVLGFMYLFIYFSVGLVAMVVVWFFLFVCEFGYDCGLRLKLWFCSCGCGHRGFGGYGCVAIFTVAIAAERWERGKH